MRVLVVSIFFVCILFPVSAGGEEKDVPRRLAVMKFATVNCRAAIAGISRNAVEMRLFNEDKFEILEQQQVDKLASQHKETLQGENERLRKIGRLLKAGFMVTGTVEKLGGYRITLRVFDVEGDKVIYTASVDVDALEDLREGSGDAAGKISRGLARLWGEYKPGEINLTTAFLYAFPMGHLEKLCRYGYGFDLRGRYQNIFFQGIFAGGIFSFLYFPGRDNTLHHSWMTALQLSLGYEVELSLFRVRVFAAGGMGYNSICYYRETVSEECDTMKGFQPLLRSGLEVSASLWRQIMIFMGAAYGHIFDAGGAVSWMEVSAGMRFRI